jgi:GNAT superfamily N-acetyltransferase
VFNSVFYDQGERLLASLEEIAAAYAEAGVRAWTVWVPESEVGVAEALEQAGHLLDATPRAMAMEISELRPPDPDSELEITETDDSATVARLNEIAYGLPPGDFRALAQSIPETRIYLGELDGETVGCTMTFDHGDDCEITFVATVPEARGRGISGRLMARALADAAERGLATTTLQATTLGYPVYQRLGYRDFGILQMWERRQAGLDE